MSKPLWRTYRGDTKAAILAGLTAAVERQEAAKAAALAAFAKVEALEEARRAAGTKRDRGRPTNTAVQLATKAMAESYGSVSEAAKVLGMSPKGVRQRIEQASKLGL